jgi:hypothetical protein
MSPLTGVSDALSGNWLSFAFRVAEIRVKRPSMEGWAISVDVVWSMGGAIAERHCVIAASTGELKADKATKKLAQPI